MLILHSGRGYNGALTQSVADNGVPVYPLAPLGHAPPICQATQGTKYLFLGHFMLMAIGLVTSISHSMLGHGLSFYGLFVQF